MGHAEKFANFIKLCDKAKAEGVMFVVVAWPSVLGDTYDEIIENLSLAADAGLSVAIAGRQPAKT